ncbi:DUF305 domain-containing protein [Cereibacter sphaeroides]|uniref:DUF305 domain-containing protein n=1 Tax=Cereibacter sphaeroides TaxID=1063 RepID=UPI001F21175F|nr:DUF305 domain-containing protein [Cereibacter sphaeroides]MCE6967379.1 DUF305 domain-containing protein [Cereibacter sphaeroides]
MSYLRFALMILTSTLVMFGLMYLNTYAWEHVFFSQTRAWMALVMGAAMAVIMLGFMWGMYRNRVLNLAILGGSALVFAVSLWLVRSQATVDGESYMRAMIPHHSIAIMTSERAGIRDPRVRKLADEIIEAQRREIGEMGYLVGEIGAGRAVDSVYEDPPARVGDVAAALSTVRRAALDPAPVPASEADRILPPADRCAFHRSRESDPILWVGPQGGAAMKLNGILVALEGPPPGNTPADYAAEGVTMTLRPLGESADWRGDADLIFALEGGPTVGYRGFWRCGG